MTSVDIDADPMAGAAQAYEQCWLDPLLMGPRPSVVIRFDGLVGPADATPGGPRATHAAPPFGSLVRFVLPPEVRGLRDLSPSRLLRLVEPGCRLRRIADRQRRLAELVDVRVAELPLPDACLVVVRSEPCLAPPADLLTALAVLSKCLTTVWLRRRAPSFASLDADSAVVLLVPPAFASQWQLPMAPPPPPPPQPLSLEDLLRDPDVWIDCSSDPSRPEASDGA